MNAWLPYLVVIGAGFIPNEVFRVAAVLVSRGVDENSRFFVWIKIVATTLLAAVVSRLIYAPAASLATVPIWVRILGIGIGVAAYFALRRSLILGILIGEAAFIAIAWGLPAQ